MQIKGGKLVAVRERGSTISAQYFDNLGRAGLQESGRRPVVGKEIWPANDGRRQPTNVRSDGLKK